MNDREITIRDPHQPEKPPAPEPPKQRGPEPSSNKIILRATEALCVVTTSSTTIEIQVTGMALLVVMAALLIVRDVLLRPR